MTMDTSFVTSCDQRALRNVLGRFATGIAVVSGSDRQGNKLGCTISSFNSVSLSPPLVLFSIANQALSLPEWLCAEHFGISVLSDRQSHISTRFSRAQTEKWQDTPHFSGPETGVPLIEEALAWFECAPYSTVEGGDHTIFIARIIAHRTSPLYSGEPLVFFDGGYRQILPRQ